MPEVKKNQPRIISIDRLAFDFLPLMTGNDDIVICTELSRAIAMMKSIVVAFWLAFA